MNFTIARRERENSFKHKVIESVKELTDNFTKDEQMRITIVPLMLSYAAWHYADLTLSLGVAYKVSFLKKLTRAVRELRKTFDYEVSKDLNPHHVHVMERETEKFMNTFGHDFTILYFSVNSEFKREHPDYPYDDMRTYAIMSMLMIELQDRQNRSSDKLITGRIGRRTPTRRMREIDALHDLMRGYAGIESGFDMRERNIVTALNVIWNRINEISFNLV